MTNEPLRDGEEINYSKNTSGNRMYIGYLKYDGTSVFACRGDSSGFPNSVIFHDGSIQ